MVVNFFFTMFIYIYIFIYLYTVWENITEWFGNDGVCACGLYGDGGFELKKKLKSGKWSIFTT